MSMSQSESAHCFLPWRQLTLWPLPNEQASCPLSPSRESDSSKRQSRTSSAGVHKPSELVEKIVGVSKNGIRLGEDSPHAKYTDVEIDAVFNLFDEGYSFAAIARMLDMPKSTAWAIVNGRMRSTMVDRWEKRKYKG